MTTLAEHTFKRPRRKAMMSLPPARVRSFTTELVNLTGYGLELIDPSVNRAGERVEVVSRVIAEFNSLTEKITQRTVWDVRTDAGCSTFRTADEAFAYAQQWLRERDYGGYHAMNDGPWVPISGRKGRPGLPEIKVVVNDGVVVAADGERVLGTLPERYQSLLVASLRAGVKLEAELNANGGALQITIKPL